MSTESQGPREPAVDEIAENHTYDGITEYDNPTPFWWNALFIGTVLFAPLYVLWFHSPQAGNTLEDQYQTAFANNMKLQFGELGTLEPDEATLAKYMADPDWLPVGQATFITNCASCHGKQGQGISAPNLTDEYFIHVKKITDIAGVVQNGAKAGAMPAWGNRLHPNEVVLVSAYVASMRGQNIDSARKAEGNPIDPWPTPKASEDTSADAGSKDGGNS